MKMVRKAVSDAETSKDMDWALPFRHCEEDVLMLQSIEQVAQEIIKYPGRNTRSSPANGAVTGCLQSILNLVGSFLSRHATITNANFL